MALDTLEIFGQEFTNVTGIVATDDNDTEKTYIRPQGTKSITENGTGIDVTNYASVDVDVYSGETIAFSDVVENLPNGGQHHIITGIDLSSDTVNASHLATGYTAHDARGRAIVGTMSGGDESIVKKQINFIDYDGTILHSYTKTEWQNVSALPENPSNTGLIAQGWNWTKAQIDAQLTAMPNDDVWVGQMYITESGDTEIDIFLDEPKRLSPILTIAVNGTVTVDWGDNTTADTVTGTSLTSRKAVPHTYASVGNYTIKIHVASGSFQFYGDGAYTLLRRSTKSGENIVYARSVQAVRFGSGVTSIGAHAFNNCQSLVTITIPSGVTSIGASVCYYCYSLSSITIPSGVTSIAGYAFQVCRSLTSVAIPSGVTTVANDAFNGCHSIPSITIPSGVTSIGNYAFENCKSFTSITIPSGVTSIGAYFFYGCDSLSSITMPSGLTSIGMYAFQKCNSLTSITIPSGVTSIGSGAFSESMYLASIELPNGITSIAEKMFYECRSLYSITIPSGVTSIGNYAFSTCYWLAVITIPSGVTSIGDNAFQYCYGATEYHIEPTTPPTLGTNAFNSIPSDCVIYVPSASLEAYKAAANWSTYASYMRGE